MPPVQRSRTTRTALSKATSEGFVFPPTHHLNVTTSEHVRAVDKNGARELFISRSQGIVAAKESNDGRSTLAISDNHNVILHQVEGGLEKSWRLKGSDGQIRLLEFSSDSKILFFTTTLLNAVQAYSLQETRLLEPGPTHNSQPSALALSCTSDTLITASEHPPQTYLQNRLLGTQPLLVRSATSNAPVMKACFHPERSNFFLLALKDGSVAAYDGTKLDRGEIHTFKNLHAVSSRAQANNELHACGPTAFSISGVAFVPGYRGRAITCGGDGKCRIIDFDKRTIIRSWHVRAPATSMALFSVPSSRSHLIAVGKLDGKVSIHDLSGATLREMVVEEGLNCAVLDVAWLRGSSPRAVLESPIKIVDENCIELYTVAGSLRSRRARSGTDDEAFEVQALKTCDGMTCGSENVDETSIGTICFKPREGQVEGSLVDNVTRNYMDLFSPVKPRRSPTSTRQNSPKRRSTPRHRPRISSTTFVDQKPNALPQRSPDRSTSKFTEIFDSDSAPPLQSAIIRRPNTIKPQDRRESRARPGSFALFAPYLPQSTVLDPSKKRNNRRRSGEGPRSSTSVSSPTERKLKGSGARSKNPGSADADNDDIWLTAESDIDEDQNEDASTSTLIRRPSGRRSIWSGLNSRQKPQRPDNLSHRPSIELRMSPPVAKVLCDRRAQEVADRDSARTHVDSAQAYDAEYHTPAIAELDPSRTSTSSSFETVSDVDETILADPSSLQPGFAQSFQGPVSVNTYLPRKSSLAFPSSPPVIQQRRSVMGEVSGNEQRMPKSQAPEKTHDEATCECCSRTRDEIRDLKEELAELRRLVKGKDRRL